MTDIPEKSGERVGEMPQAPWHDGAEPGCEVCEAMVPPAVDGQMEAPTPPAPPPAPSIPPLTPDTEDCRTCQHSSTYKRPKVAAVAGYDAYVEFEDTDEVIYGCRAPASAYAGTERLEPIRCDAFERGQKRGLDPETEALLARAAARKSRWEDER